MINLCPRLADIPIIITTKLARHIPQREDSPKNQLRIVLRAEYLSVGRGASVDCGRARRRPRLLR